MFYHILQFDRFDAPGGIFTQGFKGRDDIQFTITQLAGFDGAAIDHDGRAVQACQRHEGTGHVLVTADHGGYTVIPLGADNRFNTVGNQIAAGQGAAHAVSTHADAIADPDSMENQTHQVLILHALLDDFRQVIQVHVAGVAFPAGAGNADLRLFQVFAGQADAMQHGLGGRQAGILSDGAAVLVEVFHG